MLTLKFFTLHFLQNYKLNTIVCNLNFYNMKQLHIDSYDIIAQIPKSKRHHHNHNFDEEHLSFLCICGKESKQQQICLFMVKVSARFLAASDT